MGLSRFFRGLAYPLELKFRKRRQERLESIVNAAIASVKRMACEETPAPRQSFYYGAMEIDPRHLVIWYIFATESDEKQANEDGVTEKLDRWTRSALIEKGYPQTSVPRIHVGTVNDETVQRETGGNYYLYFK